MDTTGRVALLIADHSSFHNMAGEESKVAALLELNFLNLRCCLCQVLTFGSAFS